MNQKFDDDQDQLVSITFHCPEELRDQLDLIAKEEGRSRDDMIKKLLTDLLMNH